MKNWTPPSNRTSIQRNTQLIQSWPTFQYTHIQDDKFTSSTYAAIYLSRILSTALEYLSGITALSAWPIHEDELGVLRSTASAYLASILLSGPLSPVFSSGALAGGPL